MTHDGSAGFADRRRGVAGLVASARVFRALLARPVDASAGAGSVVSAGTPVGGASSVPVGGSSTDAAAAAILVRRSGVLRVVAGSAVDAVAGAGAGFATAVDFDAVAGFGTALFGAASACLATSAMPLVNTSA
jgi:hypothetical protein